MRELSYDYCRKKFFKEKIKILFIYNFKIVRELRGFQTMYISSISVLKLDLDLFPVKADGGHYFLEQSSSSFWSCFSNIKYFQKFKNFLK